MAQINLAETAAASVTSPAASKDALYFDSSDGYLKVKNSSGNSRTVENSVYRTIHEAFFHVGSGITAGTFLPNTSSIKSGVDIAAAVLPSVRISSSDLGTGAKLRVVMQVMTNATAPGTITFTPGLYPVTVAGGSSAFVPTLGTVTPGSNGGTVVNPSASTVTQGSGHADFAATACVGEPASFVLGLVTSATSATNSFTKVTMTLQVRNT